MSSESSPRHPPTSVKHAELRLLTPLTAISPSTPLVQLPDSSGPLTPDTTPLGNPFAALNASPLANLPSIRTIGDYELSETKLDEFKCARHLPTGEALLYKEYPLETVRQRLEPYQRLLTLLQLMNKHSGLTAEQIAKKHHLHFFRDILTLERTAVVIFSNYTTNLHQYITEKHRLNENETRQLFSQIIRAVQMCHRVGLIVRDLKLRKIIFDGQSQTQLLLTGLDEAIMLASPQSDNDMVSSRFSCPVYACPEIVLNRQMYSGKMADSWSLGIQPHRETNLIELNWPSFRYHTLYDAFRSISILWSNSCWSVYQNRSLSSGYSSHDISESTFITSIVDSSETRWTFINSRYARSCLVRRRTLCLDHRHIRLPLTTLEQFQFKFSGGFIDHDDY